MTPRRDQLFAQVQQRLGCVLDGEIKVGGHYAALVQHGNICYVSGQVPRVGDKVVVTGRVGAEVDMAQAQHGARIAVLRALTLLQKQLGSLDAVARVVRMTVFVQCTETFTQHSEVADAASDLLYEVLGQSGVHSRTSVGVYQLPKNASVEIDVIAFAQDDPC
jgi:enamine deaminase RidA (YjgF/YER057c/UK114 family)